MAVHGRRRLNSVADRGEMIGHVGSRKTAVGDWGLELSGRLLPQSDARIVVPDEKIAVGDDFSVRVRPL